MELTVIFRKILEKVHKLRIEEIMPPLGIVQGELREGKVIDKPNNHLGPNPKRSIRKK